MAILGLLTKSLLRVAMAAAIIALACAAYISAQPFMPVNTQPAQQLLVHEKSADKPDKDMPATQTTTSTAPITQPAPALPTEPTTDPCFSCPVELSTGAQPDMLCADSCPLPNPWPYNCPPCVESWHGGRPLMICPMIACRALDSVDTAPAP